MLSHSLQTASSIGRYQAANLLMSRALLKSIKPDEILAGLATHEKAFGQDTGSGPHFITRHCSTNGIDFQIITEREDGRTSICLEHEDAGF